KAGQLPTVISAIPEFPEPGWYVLQERSTEPGKSRGSTRIVKRDVPVQVWQVAEIEEETGDIMADVLCYARVGEKMVDIYDKWLTWATWGFGFLRPITEAEYRFLLADQAWLREYGDTLPSTSPPAKPGQQPMDWLN